MNMLSGAMDSAKAAAASAVPDMPSMPSVAGGINKKDIEDARTELKSTQTDIDGKLKAPIPKVKITIPRLDALPGPKPEGYKAAKPDEAAALVPGDVPDIPEVPNVQALMDSALPFASAAIGVGMATAMAIVSKGAPTPAMLMGTAAGSTLVTTLGTAKFWDAKAMHIQKAAMSVVGGAKKKISTVLNQVDDMLCKPVSAIEKQIDTIGKDDPLKKVMDGGKMAEKMTGVDVPDPQDFKKPLDGIPKMLEDQVQKVNKMVADKIDEYVPDIIEKASTFRMYVVILPMVLLFLLNATAAVVPILTAPPANATAAKASGDAESRRLFLARVEEFEGAAEFGLPVVADFGTLAAGRMLAEAKEDDKRDGAKDDKKAPIKEKKGNEQKDGAKDDKKAPIKEKKGNEKKDGAEDDKKAPTGEKKEKKSSAEGDEKEDGEKDDKKGPGGVPMDKIMAIIKPQISQAVVTVTVAILGMVATAKPFVLKQLNGAIGMLEKKVNNKIETELKEIVDKVFGTIFKELQDKSAEFFPKMLNLLDSLMKLPGM